MQVRAQIAILMVFVGCCTNVFFLEHLISALPSSGNIITFAQFAFIAFEGYIFTSKFGTVKPKIPIKTYSVMVMLFFLIQVINNFALSFNVPLPLHMIFRSGSLIANLVLGMFILKRKYTITKYLSVILITMGIIICTLQSASQPIEDERQAEKQMYISLIGITMMTCALFLSARMGIYQETVYAKHGKHPREALFFYHALPLPGFLLLTNDIMKHVHLYSASEPVSVGFLDIPLLWLYLLGNVITQYICIRSVFVLTTECSSLTVTLVVTLRKFISLLFSIWYFQNPFSGLHWLGTLLVFGGTLAFTGIIFPAQKKTTKKIKTG